MESNGKFTLIVFNTCTQEYEEVIVTEEVYGTDELTDFLEMVSQRCKFAYWFFGHYHENRIIDQKYILQWEKISELGF